jgi:hypothetical protein
MFVSFDEFGYRHEVLIGSKIKLVIKRKAKYVLRKIAAIT